VKLPEDTFIATNIMSKILEDKKPDQRKSIHDEIHKMLPANSPLLYCFSEAEKIYTPIIL